MPRKSTGKHRPSSAQNRSRTSVAATSTTSEVASSASGSVTELSLEDEITSLTRDQVPGEVVIISTSGKQYHPITAVNSSFTNAPNSTSNPATSAINNKVVSSNPTLNLLLSQPIVTMAPTRMTTVTTPSPSGPILNAGRKRLRSSVSSSSSSNRKAATKASKTPSKPVPEKAIAKSPSPFLQMIRKMMHSFGDAKTPHPDSAKLIEDIVQSQMKMLIEEAQTIALTRGSKSIGVEEFLFLLRNDINKLAKLVRFLHFKDIKSKLCSGDEGGKVSKEDDSIDFETAKPETFFPGYNQTKRVRLCYDFLSSIDSPLGRFATIFTEDFYPDKITQARTRRLSDFTERMSVRDYLFYQSCRSVSFSSTPASKFLDWILPKSSLELLEVKLAHSCFETLQHLAHETVANIVEIALIVKSEERRDDVLLMGGEGTAFVGRDVSTSATSSSSRSSTFIRESSCPETKKFALEVMSKATERFAATFGARPLGLTLGTSSVSAEKGAVSSSSSRRSSNPWAGAISPGNILEAMRRFGARPTIFSRWSRGPTAKSARKKILCL